MLHLLIISKTKSFSDWERTGRRVERIYQCVLYSWTRNSLSNCVLIRLGSAWPGEWGQLTGRCFNFRLRTSLITKSRTPLRYPDSHKPTTSGRTPYWEFECSNLKFDIAESCDLVTATKFKSHNKHTSFHVCKMFNLKIVKLENIWLAYPTKGYFTQAFQIYVIINLLNLFTQHDIIKLYYLFSVSTLAIYSNKCFSEDTFPDAFKISTISIY